MSSSCPACENGYNNDGGLCETCDGRSIVATKSADQPDDSPSLNLLFAARLGLGFVENPSCVAIDLPTVDGMSRWNREASAKIIQAAIKEASCQK